MKQNDIVRYLGSVKECYGQVGLVSGVYTSGDYLEIKLNDGTMLDNVRTSSVEVLNGKNLVSDYEVIQNICIGETEIIIGENQYAKDDMKYLCTNIDGYVGFFPNYQDAVVSNDYIEIVEIFGKRINEQAQKTREELSANTLSKAAITKEQCHPLSHSDDINGKVVAIKVSSLRREYRMWEHQLVLVNGGFGAGANSRGRAVFGTEIYSGKRTEWKRQDVEGVVKDEYLPSLAKEKLAEIKNKSHKERNDAR